MPSLEVQFENIHPICIVLGEIKQQLVEELPHFGHHGLFFQNDEITTGQLNNKTEIKINLITGELLYFHNEKGHFINLKKDNILEKLKEITSDLGIKFSEKPLQNVNLEELQNYHDFAIKAKQILELFRMKLRDNFTLIHLWPHHFDFSLEWFTGNNDEQIGIGISPADENYSFPYLYMNPWPFNEKTTEESLPIGKWNTKPWNGIKVEWEELVQLSSNDAAQKLHELFLIAKKSF
jgi:hypothetical protein